MVVYISLYNGFRYDYSDAFEQRADLFKEGRKVMRMSTMKGIAAGGLFGFTVGAGMMMMPQGKRMKRVLAKNGPQLMKQVADCWIK